MPRIAPVDSSGLALQECAMGRKPNYRFERAERDRQKAAKKAERLKARQERSGEPGDGTAEGGSDEGATESTGFETPSPDDRN
jgi:hypothetical protein